MNSKKIFFVLSILGILVLMFIGTIKNYQTGTIKNIKISNSKTTILLKESEVELIIFDSNINLQKGDIIRFQGKSNIYKNKKQIIIDEIYKMKI